jgi:diguanylate cyclase (GGDEF)-like protein
VVYVGIDGLKSVNDAHGHAVGDGLIRSVADVLRRAFRAHDTIARVGGDEFVVLLVSTDLGVASSLVARVHQYLARSASPPASAPRQQPVVPPPPNSTGC